MKSRIRMFAGAIIVAGAALLVSPSPAHSTMSKVLLDPLGTKFCCSGDTDGDGRSDSYCCYSTGCSAGPRGCVRVGP